MRRTVIACIFALSLCITASAQPSQRQKAIHMAAVRIADRLEIGDSDRDAFITLYQNYKRECGGIMSVRPQETADQESSAEAKILSDFDKSEKILVLRKAYYFKFREIIPPSSIQKMYDLERSIISTR